MNAMEKHWIKKTQMDCSIINFINFWHGYVPDIIKETVLRKTKYLNQSYDQTALSVNPCGCRQPIKHYMTIFA